MKTLFSVIILVVAFSVSSCKQSAVNKNTDQTEQIADVYTCPMHPEVQSDTMGTCPKCGMDLVKKDEHNHPDSSSNVDDEIK